MDDDIDARLHAWLTGRSIARGLPAPVPDHGGYRVDTGSEAETCRWVFARPVAGITALAATIRTPRRPIKLCGEPDALRAVLPEGWAIQPPNWFMRSSGGPVAAPAVDRYRIETHVRGGAIEVRIVTGTGTGEIAASGHAAETPDAFVYDRIVTADGHRRRGLGTMVMAALGGAKRRDVPELLVATDAGRALYERLGWRTFSAYSTATILPRFD